MDSEKKKESLDHQIKELATLLTTLKALTTPQEKIAVLNRIPLISNYLNSSDFIRNIFQGADHETEFAIKSILAIGQGPVVFNTRGAKEHATERLQKLLNVLIEIERFYAPIGGIIGYQLTLLSMISAQKTASTFDYEHTHYIHPEGLHLDEDTFEVRQATRWGIENLNHMAEIYPVGGAGDRLNLVDPITHIPLPAALLSFTGKTLLEGLIRDLQAREYLYYKLHGKQLTTPVAMMTSAEKNNHSHILSVCNAKKWFGRPSQSFFFFIQPLVPVVTVDGNWSLSAPLTLTLKPGGHGVIWKLADEQGVFVWLLSQGRTKTLLRQINNPLATLDQTILAFLGHGFREQKMFGFVSCERLINSAEGTNVLIETESAHGFEYRLTNIEYTDFAQKGIGEEPAKPGSPYSTFPANTNILFADLHAIHSPIEQCIIPGKIINMKSKVPYRDPEGHLTYTEGGRLESTMQNIADYFVERFPLRLSRQDYKHLRTYIVYNQRSKTISSTKKSYKSGESPDSTPEQAYYDLLVNHAELLKTHCHFALPELGSIENYLKQGPGFIFLYHPALGPLYSVIGQKVRHGTLSPGSELQLEIAEVDIEDLDVDGSLLIEAKSPLGVHDENGLLKYGNESRCSLHHVKVHNKGINRQKSCSYWKNQFTEREAVQIVLHEGAEFHAEHVTFNGAHYFEVPAHHRLSIEQDATGQLVQNLQAISKLTWQWRYQYDADHHLQLKLE